MAESPVLSVSLREERPIPLNVQFDCPAGEILALVGPSGSGKSTVLRSIAGLYAPQYGNIRCMGETWLDTQARTMLPTHRRRLGMVFQSYALFPHMNVLRNIMTPLDELTPVEREARARELVAKMHLAGLEERMPAQLSGGQQQRVALARAMSRDPKVLLLDEPFSALDKAVRHELYDELLDLRGSLNIPVVLVTHDFSEAQLLGDAVIVLNHGECIQRGTPVEVFNRPSSMLAARLLGVRNMFFGTVLEHDHESGHTIIGCAGQQVKAPLRPGLAEGSAVHWHIPPEDVLFEAGGGSCRVREGSKVSGVVQRAVVMPPVVRLTLLVGDDLKDSLTLESAHPALRANLPQKGDHVVFSLAYDAIHTLKNATDMA